MGSQTYQVQITDNGPAGWVIYIEDGRKLAFEWEFCAQGTLISVPTAQEWDRYCEKNDAGWAVGRRQEILERIAQETRRQKVKSAEISFKDDCIILSFKDHWVFSLLRKLFSL